MKRIFFFIATFLSLYSFAQDQNLKETAAGFMRSGDFDNAIVVLNRALQQDQNNLELQKDLALSYYYKRDYAKASEQVKPMLERNDADEATFQIAGNVYKALEEVKDGEKVYKKGLKKFPNSGALYSEYGELLWSKKDYDAIKLWEKGLQIDPSYAGNYYNAATYYFYTKDKVWSVIYSEIFVNMENLTDRSTAIKQLLLQAYKEKLFAEADVTKDAAKNDFAKAFLTTMAKQSSMANKGVTTESLTAIRTRFILDWFTTYAAKYPFKLFDYQQQLIKEGLFEAYNQWLFGTTENLPAFDNWTKTHADAYNSFTAFQRGRVFKMPTGQFYGAQ